MSEASSGDDIRRRCASIVLRHFVACDEAKTKALAVILRDDDVITKDERRALSGLVKAGNCSEAVESMINSAAESDGGLKYLVEAVKDEELMLDDKIPRVLGAVFSDDPSNNIKITLISLWEELLTFREDVKPAIEQLWPDAHNRLTEAQWPLDFIFFCIETQDLQKVEDFVSSASFLKIPATPTENLEMTDASYQREAETIGDQDQSSGDFESSFVVLGYGGTEETVPQKQERFGADDFKGKKNLNEDQGGASISVETDPLKTSTTGDEVVKKELEDALGSEDSPQESMQENSIPAQYVSEDSSFAAEQTDRIQTGAPDSSPSPNDDSIEPPNGGAGLGAESEELEQEGEGKDQEKNLDPASPSGFKGTEPSKRGYGPTEGPADPEHEDEAQPRESPDPPSPPEGGNREPPKSDDGSAKGPAEPENKGESKDESESLDPASPPGFKGTEPSKSGDDPIEGPADPEHEYETQPRESPDPPSPPEGRNREPPKSDNGPAEGPAEPENKGESKDESEKSPDPPSPPEGGNREPPKSENVVKEDPTEVEHRNKTENETNRLYPVLPTEEGNRKPVNSDVGIAAGSTNPEQRDEGGNQSNSYEQTLRPSITRENLLSAPSPVTPIERGDESLMDFFAPDENVDIPSKYDGVQEMTESYNIAQQTLSIEERSHSASVEFRAVFARHEALIEEGWQPALNINKRWHVMHLHRSGYYFTVVRPNTNVVKYTYALRTATDHKTEYLPQKSKRVLNWEQGEMAFDVVCFSKPPTMRKWSKEVNENIHRYLPTPSSLMGDDTDFSPIGICAWMEAVTRGWKLTDPKFFHKVDKTVLEDILIGWLVGMEGNHNGTMHYTARHILCSLAVVNALYNLKHVIENSKLFARACKGLHIHKLTMEYQSAICGRACREFNCKPQDLCQSLEFLFGHAKTFVDPTCILSFPLYWMIQDEGNFKDRSETNRTDILYNRAMLPPIKEDKWQTFRDKMIKKSKDLKRLCDTIGDTSELHPWIVDTLQYFLSGSMLIDLISEKRLLAEKFQLDSVFTRLLPLLQPVNFTNTPKKINEYRKRIATHVSEYLTKQFTTQANDAFIESLKPERRIVKATSACHILALLNETVAAVVDENKFDSSQRSCILWLMTMASRCLSWFMKLGRNEQYENQPSVQLRSMLDCVKLRILKFVFIQNTIDAEEVQFYNNLLNKSWEDPDFQKSWIGELSEQMEEAINKQWPGDAVGFLEFYLGTLKDVKLDESLDLILRDKAEKFADSLMTYPDTSYGSFLTCIAPYLRRDRSRKVFVNVFKQAFSKYHERGEERFRFHVIQFLAESPVVLRFHRAFDQRQIDKLFSSRNYATLKQIDDIANTLVSKMSREELTVEEMKVLIENKKRVMELLILKDERNGPQIPVSASRGKSLEIEGLFIKGKSTLEAYKAEREALNFFVNFCLQLGNGFKVDCTKIKQIIGRKESNLEIRNLNKKSVKPEERSEILLINCLKESQVFLSKTRNVASGVRNQIPHAQITDGVWKPTWTEVLDAIWKKAKAEILKFVEEVNNATLVNETLTKEFSFTNGEKDALREELLILYRFSSAAKKERVEDEELKRRALEKARQLSYVFEIQRKQDVLKWFGEFQQKYKLAGDFQAIIRFQDSHEGLSDSAYRKLADVLKITGEELNVLQAFTKQQELIGWLQSNMMDEGQVRGLCIVAAESSRYNATQADKWSFLSDAVAGFEALIFHLDKINGRADLMARCRDVWQKVEADAGILSKWSAVGSTIGWYKENEKLYASEDQVASSFAQRANINGIYTVGNYLNVDSNVATLKDSIKLEFSDTTPPSPSEKDSSAKESEDGSKKFTAQASNFPEKIDIDYLHDVESKLMLIAGDGDNNKNEINQFVSVLHAMESLAKAYVDLVNAGFMLFSNWKVTANLKQSESRGDLMCEHILTLQISFKSDVRILSRTASIQDVIMLSDLLRDALKRWDSHVSKMRLKHYFLNEYSIQQIKYLCGQLGKAPQNQLEEQAHALLSDMPRSAMTSMIQNSLVEATATTDQEEIEEDQDANIDADAGVSEEVALIRRKRRAARHLVNRENTTETLAKAAVEAEGHEKYVECCNWILLHEYDDDLVDELAKKFDQAAGFVYDQQDVQEDVYILQNRLAHTLSSMIQILQERAAETGCDLLEAVKTIYVGYLKNTTTLTLQDYLSVNHLGKFLTILHSKMEETQPSPTRVLPHSFKNGVPNFILSEKRGVIPLILSLYAKQPEQETTDKEKSRDPPLPTPAEVLICSAALTADEVERFMLQAMCKHPADAKLIFCLAYTELLNFNMSKALENIFGKLSHDAHVSNDYQLVIICSDPHHYVANCFDKYQVEKLPDFDDEEIDDYVKVHMRKETELKEGKVKVVSSRRSGVGKSLRVKRIVEGLPENCHSTTVRLLEKEINRNKVIERLFRSQNSSESLQLIHIDVTPAVENGIEKFVFDLAILGMIKDSSGKVWRRRTNHSYVIEVTKQGESWRKFSHTLELLPTEQCLSPVEVLRRLGKEELQVSTLRMMDEKEYQSDIFQRPYQYLIRHERKEDLGKFDYKTAKKQGSIKSSQSECLEVLFRNCGITDPSWAQLMHFVSFLNVQLVNCEKSVYCLNLDELRGLKELAVKFMIRMAQDFATPSLVISDQSAKVNEDDKKERDVLEDHQLRRKWEENEHPYVFFNDDGVTMSFINVNIDRNGNLLDKKGAMMEQGLISRRLVDGLRAQGIDLGHNFYKLPRKKMIEKLCLIMGVNEAFDPDQTYELTTDNVLKMIAIYMRFRCNIPVIIMGETGCGKTRMVEFMSKLQAGKKKTGSSMTTLKIHGGIGVDDIFKSVSGAVEQNSSKKILFYDEANTTTAIYAIKEVMCDLTIDGNPFIPDVGREEESDPPKLQIVAACNPYKQMSPEALVKLESSGLGYRVATSKTSERLGSIAMRTLVYRVVALPPSIQPFVWDFGQLADETEKIYIEKMVASKLKSEYRLSDGESSLIVDVLSHIQAYMKKQKNECRYVSLRDVERTIKLFKWFHKHKERLFKKIDDVISKDSDIRNQHPQVRDSLRCLIHAIGITYHVSLESREAFRYEVSDELSRHAIEYSQHHLLREYQACQNAFHRDLKTDDNIAWNEALRENVYLMTVCADVKLPLYLIGKPGSSKSLAKSIVDANMKGPSSGSLIFKEMKKVEIVSYQCSALTKAAGIKKVFKDAAERQKSKDLEKFAAMVVLDEIGLAEDSPNMPLKILHPLLECGNAESGSLTEYEESDKVAFVGISNWALDPAKMNRGIFVTRNTPDENDLFDTAAGIFQGSMGKVNEHHTLLENLTKTYLHIYKEQGDQYFGLRDYYCVIKLIRSMWKANRKIERKEIAYVLVRNFSGGKRNHFLALKEAVSQNLDLPEAYLSQTSLKTLIEDNIASSESRFLLLLTAEHSSVNLLHYVLPDFDKTIQVIFGSSFPGDHTYTEICRNINQIKLCMERGKRVVLLNMDEIHESLYDVLNQYYIRFGSQRYVAIGLGSHRVWTRVHEDFRLIVIEKRETAQKDYPIPLINRLEKHHLLSSSLLDPNQLTDSKKLSQWMRKFATVGDFGVGNAFIGSHDDTASSVVLAYSDEGSEKHKSVMLQVASADSVYRLPETRSSKIKAHSLIKTYMEEQTHDCLFNLLLKAKENKRQRVEIFEIISFSNILTEEIRITVETKLNLIPNSVMLLSLQQFKVEEEYRKKLDDFFVRCEENTMKDGENAAVLLIQTSQAQQHGQLIECAKHNFMNRWREVEVKNVRAEKVIVAFIFSTERSIQRSESTSGIIIQHTQKCKTVYVDELRHTESNASTTLISSFYGKSLGDILEEGKVLVDRDGSTNSHVLCLLQDCISEAMSKVTTSVTKNGRQLKRIKELRKICTQTSSGEVGQGFLKILLEKMMKLAEKGNKAGKLEWVIDEACSQQNLQEGGTFGKTIHLYLKRCLVDMLAYIVSIIDENDNMSLLAAREQGMEWKLELWLQIFHVLDVGKPTQDQLEYTIKTPKHVNLDFACKFPFSFVIHEGLCKQYDLAKGHERSEQFFYKNASQENEKVLGKVMQSWNSSSGMKMMQAYAYDLMKFQFKPAANSQDELDNLVKILFECSKKRWMELERKINGVFVTFHTFMLMMGHLLVLSSIFNISPDIMQKVEFWIKLQRQHQDFRIHEYALDYLLDWAHEQAGKIKNETSCMDWMTVCSQMKKTYKSLVDVINPEERKEELRRKWKPLALLDTLLMHLLPWNKKDRDYLKYVSLVVEQAMRLFKALDTMPLHGKEILKIITTVLRKSYEDLELKLKMKWQKPNCVCGRRIHVPIEVPCGCFICQNCADLIKDDSRTCPKCTKLLPKDFEKLSPRLSPDNEKELKRFQANCTGFFLGYLYEFCFDGNAKEKDASVKILAVFEHTLLPEELQANHKEGRFKLETTKLDLNIATKSSIFQLIWKLDEEFTKAKLDRIFRDDKFSDDALLLAILKAFENECGNNRKVELDFSNDNERLLMKSWKELLGSDETLLTVELLQRVAHVRYALSNFVKCVQERRSMIEREQMTPGLILRIKDICSKDNAVTLRRFVSKIAVLRYGKQWLQHTHCDEELKEVICPDLVSNLEKISPDYSNLLGQGYSDLKAASMQSMNMRNEFSRLFSQDNAGLCSKSLPKIMAVLQIRDRWMMTQLKKKLKNQAQESDVLLKSDQFLTHLASVPGLTIQQGHAVHQAVVLAVGLVLCKLPMMYKLYQLVMDPEDLKECFWPAMPESLYHDLNDVMMDEQPYSCPNGHVYYIGDCTYPWMMSQCPQCGAAIGGILHMKADGNERLPTSNESQQGYQLHTKKMGVDSPADRITQQAAAVTQFFIHSCMMMAMSNEQNEILKIVGKKTAKEGNEFLARKLQENVEQLSQGLGCSIDESIMILHQILARIVSHEQKEAHTEVDWANKEQRRLWENEFRKMYLVPVFQEADDFMFDAKQKLTTTDSIHKVLHEDVTLGNVRQRLTCFHPALWKYVKESTPSHLLHCIADSPLPGGVLRTMLETPNLHLVKELQNTLALQEEMIQRYQKKGDMKDLEEITFEQAIKDETYKLGKNIESYIHLWNLVYPILRVKHSNDKILLEYMERINMNSPITMMLPSSRGRGRCAKVLAEHLIDLQNEFLMNCEKADDSLRGIAEVEVSKLLPSHFVCVDKQEDLLPMIQLHTAYSIAAGGQGSHHHLSYNIPALEKQAKEKHVLYKKKISSQSLPCIKYLQDVGIGSDWDKVDRNVKQVPLTVQIRNEVDEMVSRGTLADVCEGVRTLTQAISFLAKVEMPAEDANKKLRDYLERDLMLLAAHLTMIPKSATISHTLALYQKLSCHRAVRFAQQGLDPYKESLEKDKQKKITNGEVLKSLKQAFEHTDLNALQEHVNEMLIKVPDFVHHWSLIHIFPELTFIEETPSDSWYNRLPKEICFEHVSDLFRLSVLGVGDLE